MFQELASKVERMFTVIEQGFSKGTQNKRRKEVQRLMRPRVEQAECTGNRKKTQA
jgi:hypothetical protein